MGRIGITDQNITKAIAALQGQQKNPTVDNIRKILGTSSKSTIAPFLRGWKAARGLQLNNEGSMSSELQRIIKGLWDKFQEAAHNKTNTCREKCEANKFEIQLNINRSNQQQSASLTSLFDEVI